MNMAMTSEDRVYACTNGHATAINIIEDDRSGNLGTLSDAENSFNHLPEMNANGDITTTDLRRYKLTRISERLLVCWTVMAFIVFTIAWKLTTGGYLCSLLLFSSLAVYVYSRRVLTVRTITKHIKENMKYAVQKEIRQLILLLAYAVTKVGIHIFRPELESSNGSPLSLILFTVYFIIIFILPPLLQTAWKSALYVIKCQSCRQSLGQQFGCNSNRLFHTVTRWRYNIIITVFGVVFSYVFDGDITCILRYFGHGKSCWPLLIPRSLQDTLPYPLQHAWFNKWHKVFGNYKPSTFVKELIIFGREMEVIHLLPMLIGTYILAQLLLPKENWTIKKVLFGCISGVVLSGVTSGAIKVLLHRYRPNAYGNPYLWTGPGTATVNHMSFSKLDLSFPCGHTTVTMSIAACLYLGVMDSLTYSSSLRLKLFLILCVYFYPMVVLVSRVSECYHWTSDAIFGVS